jgi:hypothetical protein
MADLVIKQEELPKLDAILGEIPTKYGVLLINFFNGIAQKRAQEAAASVPQGLPSGPAPKGQTISEPTPDKDGID